MDYGMQVSTWITTNLQQVILLLTVLIFLALIIFIHINMRLAKLNRRYEKMMKGMDGVNLENLLLRHIREVRETGERVDEIAQECGRLEEQLKVCVQRVGVVRFNAFEDTGSDLSFAVALLDSRKNGVVISSIFGRNDSRT